MLRTLRTGTRGSDVQRWQRFLFSQGLAPGRDDGIFDVGTATATRAFQTKHTLTIDAVVGPQTLALAGALGLKMLRRIANSELTPALTAMARQILARHRADPFGTEEAFELGGIHYVGRLEEHFHPPGGPIKPWGPHPGVSLFVDTLLDESVSAPDDVTDPAGVGLPQDESPAVIASTGVIVIDPGHGGTLKIGSSSPNNAQSPSGVLEEELTLKMAELVRLSLAERAPSVRVELTRNDDVNLDLADRARVAKKLKADLFLSIHFNGFDSTARGVETLIRPKSGGNVNHAEDKAFAERVQSAVHSALREFDAATPNRGVKEQDLGVLRDESLGNSIGNHPCRACLLEIEFLDTVKVDELFNTGHQAEEVRGRVANAIGEALLGELATMA
jgi:N-acetylmuramoyl-L-alanine amidase